MQSENLPTSPLYQYLLSGEEIQSLIFPESIKLVSPIITKPSISMIHATRGLGKTFLCMELAASVTLGRPFFGWDVPCKDNVLHIDGEMPTKTLQERYKFIFGCELPKSLTILPSETLWPVMSINLNIEKSQEYIYAMLEDMKNRGNNPGLIIFDNLSSLCFGMDESSNTAQDGILSFLCRLRHLGYAVVVVHHSGKNGDQRGSSRREDPFDLTIKLTPRSPNPGYGAAFNVHFSKYRNLAEPPKSFAVELGHGLNGEARWHRVGGSTGPEKRYFQALMEIAESSLENASQLGERLGVSRQAADKHLKILIENGYISSGRPLRATENGLQALMEYQSRLGC